MTSMNPVGSGRRTFFVKSRRLQGKLFLSLVALLLLAVSPAQAFYLDLTDFRGAANGRSAQIEIDGLSISISTASAGQDLSVRGSGLGVGCVGRGRDCRGNNSGRIESRFSEAVTLEFRGAAVRVDAIVLNHFGRGDTAVVDTGAGSIELAGRNGRTRPQDLGGVVTHQITLSGSGPRSDFSLAGIEISWIRPLPVRPLPNVPHPVPEPTAALLFAAGLGVASFRQSRRARNLR